MIEDAVKTPGFRCAGLDAADAPLAGVKRARRSVADGNARAARLALDHVSSPSDTRADRGPKLFRAPARSAEAEVELQ
ncbi:MAG: hypothetical protein H0T76_02405 [Nannocystis sp.]|nr:hypothetical protein [Nannocystis sp.]MBA3545313.1 hypothetical protein [Nannocystis sp.]